MASASLTSSSCWPGADKLILAGLPSLFYLQEISQLCVEALRPSGSFSKASFFYLFCFLYAALDMAIPGTWILEDKKLQKDKLYFTWAFPSRGCG